MLCGLAGTLKSLFFCSPEGWPDLDVQPTPPSPWVSGCPRPHLSEAATREKASSPSEPRGQHAALPDALPSWPRGCPLVQSGFPGAVTQGPCSFRWLFTGSWKGSFPDFSTCLSRGSFREATPECVVFLAPKDNVTNFGGEGPAAPSLGCFTCPCLCTFWGPGAL